MSERRPFFTPTEVPQLDNVHIKALVNHIGPWLKASNLKETPMMRAIRELNPIFEEALNLLGVFD